VSRSCNEFSYVPILELHLRISLCRAKSPSCVRLDVNLVALCFETYGGAHYFKGLHNVHEAFYKLARLGLDLRTVTIHRLESSRNKVFVEID
jgi:hypothetical protein